MLLSLLLRPDSYFSERMKEPEELKIPGVIAIIGGIIAASGAFLISGIYAGIFRAAAGEGMASVMGLVSAISAFFGFIIISWVVFCGIFYVLSTALKGNGTFKRTLQFTGYGLVPVIIGSFISVIILLYYLPMIDVPAISNIQDPAAIQRVMAEILEDPAFKQFSQVSAIISSVFLIWSANLWIFAVSHARAISLRNAMIVVLVPVTIFIFYTVYTAFVGIPLSGGS